MNIQDIVKRKDVHIIDVRESAELLEGKISSCVHMPLSNFMDFVEDIKKMEGPKVFYCRSGNRSGQAANYCASVGIEDVYNGGSLGMMEAYLIED